MSLSTITYRAVKNSRGVASWVAFLTITAAVAAIVIALSIASGFRKGLTEALLYSEGDFWLEYRDPSLISKKTGIMDTMLVRRLYEAGATNVEPRLSADVVILSKDGAVPFEIRSKDGINGLSVSQTITSKYGDTLDLVYSLQMPFAFPVAVDTVISFGLPELSSFIGYAPKQMVAGFRGLDVDAVDGYVVSGSDIESLSGAVGDEPLWIYDSRDRFAGLYDWLDVIDGNVGLVVLIMMAVGAVNMLAATLATILENTHTVAVLKSLGMPIFHIRSGLILRTLVFSVSGAIAGLFTGILFCWLQLHFEFIQLSAKDYLLSAVPIDISFVTDIAVTIGSILFITFSSLLATIPINRIREEKILRYE